MKRALLLLLISFAVFSCSDGSAIYKIASTGKPYEIMVISHNNVWNSAAGDTLKAIFGQEADMLNQPEPIYDIYNVLPQSANNNILRHRNLFQLNVNPSFTETELSLTYDRYASNQLDIRFTSPSNDSLAAYISQNREVLVALMDKTERDRMAKRAKEFNASAIERQIYDQFGFRMTIPRGYRVRNSNDNFLWLSNEMPLASQGIIIYTFPFLSTGDYMDADSIVARRDDAVRNVPGPRPGTYMTSEKMFFPLMKSYTINNRQWNETRGFWKVQGDFMGGPYVNYTTIDQANNRVIGIDMYVMSHNARYGRRNYIRQLENLIITVEIPLTAPQE